MSSSALARTIRVYLCVSVAALCTSVLIGCAGPEAERTAGGDARAGRGAIARYQCGVCHVIPGVADARGLVGPPLTGYARRVYIAGKLPQDPALLARWIQDAPSLAPDTAMPNVGVSETDARDIVAYLYRLR
jgi:cytochrome c